MSNKITITVCSCCGDPVDWSGCDFDTAMNIVVNYTTDGVTIIKSGRASCSGCR